MKTLAQIAYEAYGDTVGWVNYQGSPMPKWDDLTEIIKDAWQAAAHAAVVEVGKRVGRTTP